MGKSRSIRAGISGHISAVSIPSDGGEEELSPENFTALSSYNWLPGRAIAVPGNVIVTMLIAGVPRRWKEPKGLPIQIKADRGVVFLDENKARWSKYPLEPLFRSIYFLAPEFDPKSIDLVTDRKNLRELLNIISGKLVKDFRVDIQLIQDTLLFTRWGKAAKSYISGSRGYGHMFEKALGTYPKSFAQSTSHHRVVKYTLAGMRIVLRFEADGYLPSQDISSCKPVARQHHSSNAAVHATNTSSLRVISAGLDVPHNSLVELKTCNENRGLAISKVADQLWFGQVPHLKIGYHTEGKFQRIEDRDVEEHEEFLCFGRIKGQNLRKMIGVIENIRRIMKEHETHGAVLICDEKSLHLYKAQNGVHALPHELLSRWNSGEEQE